MTIEQKFFDVADNIITYAKTHGALLENPSEHELDVIASVKIREIPDEDRIKEMFKAGDQLGPYRTEHGSMVFFTDPTSRSEPHTKTNIDDGFTNKEFELALKAEASYKKWVDNGGKVIVMDSIVGDGLDGKVARAIFTTDEINLGIFTNRLLLQTEKLVDKPTYVSFGYKDESFNSNRNKPMKEKDVDVRLGFLDDGRMAKLCRNVDYPGEYVKKAIFAGEDNNAKLNDEIFLHGGGRSDRVETVGGTYITKNGLIIALSANGKTSITTSSLARKIHEFSRTVQDDGGTITRDGQYKGFENRGLYVKTDGVSPSNQNEIYLSLLKKLTYFENVMVKRNHGEGYSGILDFIDISLTKNGRAVPTRADFPTASPSINMEHIDYFVAITRGNKIPAMSLLSREEFVYAMIIGQAAESSAGDATREGKLKNEFFYDPFMVGDKAKHANRLYDILSGEAYKDTKFLYINTGGIGEGTDYIDITLPMTLSTLDSFVRGGLDSPDSWTDSPMLGKIPKVLRGVDSIVVTPWKKFSGQEWGEGLSAYKTHCAQVIEKVGQGLDPKIINAYNK